MLRSRRVGCRSSAPSGTGASAACGLSLLRSRSTLAGLGHLIASLLFGIAEIELQHAKERQAIGIALARKRGVYTGRQEGTTKAEPARARALKKQGLKIPEIAQALGILGNHSNAANDTVTLAV